MTSEYRVTVLLPVYNGESHLAEAIASILNQTYTNFELLIIDDASKDGSVAVVESFDDGRIRVLRNEKNLGLELTLNRGLQEAMGEYVARMDQDDISLPERLQRQVGFLDANSGIGLCGTWAEYFGGRTGLLAPPVVHDEMKCLLLFGSPLVHPSIMLRKQTFLESNLWYSPENAKAEDYGLWSVAVDYVRMANIPEALLRYRVHSDQMSKFSFEDMSDAVKRIRRNILNRLGEVFSDEDCDTINRIAAKRFPVDRQFLANAADLMAKLVKANRGSRYFDPLAFEAMLARKWFSLCTHSSRLGLWVWGLFRGHELAGHVSITPNLRLRLFLKCVLHYG